MRVNVYAEEMTDRIEIISKEIDGHKFTGLRIYLYLPTTYYIGADGKPYPAIWQRDGGGMSLGPDGEIQGPFLHRGSDDDSSAVTFWGKRDLRTVLRKALAELDAHYAEPRDEVAAPQLLSQSVEVGPRDARGADGPERELMERNVASLKGGALSIRVSREHYLFLAERARQ